MQSVSSRIWTCVAVSISYDDNDYTTGTSKMSGYLSACVYEFLLIVFVRVFLSFLVYVCMSLFWNFLVFL